MNKSLLSIIFFVSSVIAGIQSLFTTSTIEGMKIEVVSEYAERIVIPNVYRVTRENDVLSVVDRYGKEHIFVWSNVVRVSEVKCKE